jgi:hypothetical protein
MYSKLSLDVAAITRHMLRPASWTSWVMAPSARWTRVFPSNGS